MKKLIVYSPIIIFVLYAFVPACFLVALLGGYEFSLQNIIISAIAIMVLSVFLTILAIVQKELIIPKGIRFFAVLSLPMSLLNYFCFNLGNYASFLINFYCACVWRYSI